MERAALLEQIRTAFEVNPAVALLGPRQCGKTTLAKQIVELYKKSGTPVSYFDLEKDSHLSFLQDPFSALSDEKGLVVIDEVQRKPELFPSLRVLIDDQDRKTHYLLLGSASRDLIRQSSESLAGRMSMIEVTPFAATEVSPKELKKLWLRGGFPPAFLAKNDFLSRSWREEYISLLLERDIPNLGFKIAPQTLRRFWMMLSHYHGQIFNASEIGKSMGLSHHTIRDYLDILSGTFVVRQLLPWFENLGKRQVKSPKIYFRDSGLYHTMIDVDEIHLHNNPKIGASWEGFALEQIIRAEKAKPENVYFWSTHNEAELDLLIIKGTKKFGYEIKYTDSPKLTKSMSISMKDLQLEELTLVFPGNSQRFQMGPHISAIGMETLITILKGAIPPAL